MKVLQKSIMKDGTKIQREYWEEFLSSPLCVNLITAYPKAKESGESPVLVYPKRGETFRLEIEFKTTEEAERVFCLLESGEKLLRDCANNFSHKEYINYI